FVCFVFRGAASVVVNFGSRPPFSPLPFWCPMLQAHSVYAPALVSPSPHQLLVSPAEDPRASPLSAEVTLCVGTPGCGLFDFVDAWKRERETSRGRPLTEISSRALARWILLSVRAEAPKNALFDDEEAETIVACSRPDSADSGDTWTAAGLAAETVRALGRLRRGAAAPTAVGGERPFCGGDSWSWRGGSDPDSVAEPVSLCTGIPALDDLPRLKSELLLLAASSRRGDVLVVDVGNLLESRRREIARLFESPWFSRRCLLVAGPPPLPFAAKLQAKLHREQPRLRSLLRRLRRRQEEAEDAGDSSLCVGLREDLERLEEEFSEARMQPLSPTFSPTQPWTNAFVDDVPLQSLSCQPEPFSLPSAEEGFAVEVAWRESVEEAEKSFRAWRQKVADRRLCEQLQPPPWFKAQLGLWEDKCLALQEFQRATAARFSRALLHVGAESTVLPPDFDFGFADLAQVMRDGGDAGNSSVNKLLQALRSVEEHADGALLGGEPEGSLLLPSPSRVSGSSFSERLEFVTKKAEDEIASYSTNVDCRFPAHLSEGPWVPVPPVAAVGSEASSPYSAAPFSTSLLCSPSPFSSFAAARPSSLAASSSAVGQRELESGASAEAFLLQQVEGVAASSFAPDAFLERGEDAAALGASMEDIVREHQRKMEHVNKFAALAQAASPQAPGLAHAPPSHGRPSEEGRNAQVPRDGRFPLFIHFESEDWKLLEARVEIHMFLHAFAQVVKANEGRMPVEWFSLYFCLFFERPFNAEDFPSCLTLDDLFDHVSDTVGFSDEPPFVFPLLPAQTPLATFIALTTSV
ncbi:hypothetical protein TGMAS_293320B, partial [Toxoplasma gondii MAS]